jgi:hypothetical protein
MTIAAIETTATVTIYQIPGSPYPLKRPLTLEVERDDENYVVSDPSTGVFHYNSDFGAALSGFMRVFVDEFEFLKKNQSALSTPLSAELDRFYQLLALPVASKA